MNNFMLNILVHSRLLFCVNDVMWLVLLYYFCCLIDEADEAHHLQHELLLGPGSSRGLIIPGPLPGRVPGSFLGSFLAANT